MPLVPLLEDDLEMMLAWRNAPVVRQNMYTSHIISIEEHRAWYEKIRERDDSRWFVYEEKNGEPSGIVYFTDLNKVTRNGFWGFYAAVNAQIGIGTRMEYDALQYAFKKLNLHKLNCEILASNTKVIRLHDKFGFSIEGRFRDFHFDGKEYVDVVRMGILHNEWDARRPEILSRMSRF